jgi:hypothetical protein
MKIALHEHSLAFLFSKIDVHLLFPAVLSDSVSLFGGIQDRQFRLVLTTDLTYYNMGIMGFVQIALFGLGLKIVWRSVDES